MFFKSQSFAFILSFLHVLRKKGILSLIFQRYPILQESSVNQFNKKFVSHLNTSNISWSVLLRMLQKSWKLSSEFLLLKFSMIISSSDS